MFKKLTQKNEQGFILMTAIIILVVVTVLISIVFSLVLLSLKKSDQNHRQLSVLDIAEAGINYYLWHLAHDPKDYCDGNACPAGSGPYGPYVHNYTDSSGKVIGTYTLWIAPPGLANGGKVTICHNGNNTITIAPSAVQTHLDHGDTVGACGGSAITNAGSRVTVEVRGDINDGNENRSVVAELGIPSFANYSIVENDTVNGLRVGVGTETWGPVHNNGGVHFDGVAHAIVTSSVSSYTDPDTGLSAAGVYTQQANPNQVFLASYAYPVPPIDFSAVTANLQDLKTKGQQADGIYYGPSSGSGYHIVVKTNDTFDIYRVTGVGGTCGSASSPKENITSQVFLTNRTLPVNGVVFVEDKLWIDGKINGAQVTFAAAKIGATSSQYKSIIINSSLTYSSQDGTDKIGLVAQGDVTVGYNSDNSLEIDAAMLAQNGRVGRNLYSASCGSSYTRNSITVYGSIASNLRYGFAYSDGTGYQNRDLLYDPYLTLVPPPYFPVTGSYTILSWKEE